MPKRNLSFLLLILFIMPATAPAQYFEETSTPGNYVELYNGSIIKAQNIEYKKKFLRKNFIKADSLKIGVDSIRIIKNSSGYYRRHSSESLGGSSDVPRDFFKRIKRGDLYNIYSKSNTYYSPGVPMSTAGGGMMYTGGSMQKRSKEFYARKDGPMKKIKYRNLKEDLADNPESMKILDKVKSNHYLMAGFYVLGASSAIIGLSQVSNNNGSAGATFILLSGMSLYIPNFISNANDEKLIKAVEIYNE